MLVKKIRMHNIRSYVDEEISLGPGSTLLAGDIGSGKSSILLAMEFALFGIKRGTLGGDFLLRHGAREGSVEISFLIENKEIAIKRTLSRKKDSVGQSNGYIIVNGIKKDLTPQELKSEVLMLLGYPSELLSKSEDLIYRYTVYTPQEEMKAILLDAKGDRIDTIRKIFGVDRYKRIKENSAVFVQALREKRSALEGITYNLEEKKKLSEATEKDILDTADSIKRVLPALEDAKKKLLAKKKEIILIEDEIKKLNEFRSELIFNTANLKRETERKKILSEDINLLKKQIDELSKENLGTEEENFSAKIKQSEQEIEEMESEYRKIFQKIGEFSLIKKGSDEIKAKLTKLNNCPTCHQEVGRAHKEMIFSREDEKLKILEQENKDYMNRQAQILKAITQAKKELSVLRLKDKQAGADREKKRAYLEKKERLKSLLTDFDRQDDLINSYAKRKEEISAKIEQGSDFGKKYDLLKSGQRLLEEEEKKIEYQKARYEQKIDDLKKSLAVLEKEIEIKTKAKEEMVYLGELQNWMKGFFQELMDTIERNVMTHLQRQFNEFFREWFKMLMEDDTLNVRLDDEFSPVIEQNGYESSVENLSGGEKTSLALAYRLSLNKVINDFVSDIKTKDLIILDEPTDGFSTEQLDKLRDVLEQLNLKQVIIVSHEAKIESFVERIIRIEKREHISRII